MTQDTRAQRLHRSLWIVLAVLLASLFGSLSLLIWFQLANRRTQVRVTKNAIPSAAKIAAPRTATSFGELEEANIPGRYRITDGEKIMCVFLNEDHTFINTDGTTYAPYQWEVGPDRFIITWQRSSSTFADFERPGVYSRRKTDGGIMRMEKLPDLPPADTIAFPDRDIVASMVFTTAIQSNGLALANTEGDGAIQPGEAEGEPCYRLVRARSRMSAFLYLRIAPELKQEPFTNAFVEVEYFDGPARDPRNGWITMQYDASDGPYTSTAQRVKLAGSMSWKRATFVLDAPVFNGRQKDAADFRLCVANPDLLIRFVKLVKNKPLPSAAARTVVP